MILRKHTILMKEDVFLFAHKVHVGKLIKEELYKKLLINMELTLLTLLHCVKTNLLDLRIGLVCKGTCKSDHSQKCCWVVLGIWKFLKVHPF